MQLTRDLFAIAKFLFYIIFAVLMKYILPTFHCRVNHDTKFQANISIHDWIIITFLKIKMVAVRYLGFSKTWFWAIGRLVLRFSITVPNLVQKCWSTPKLWPKIWIQD